MSLGYDPGPRPGLSGWGSHDCHELSRTCYGSSSVLIMLWVLDSFSLIRVITCLVFLCVPIQTNGDSSPAQCAL